MAFLKNWLCNEFAVISLFLWIPNFTKKSFAKTYILSITIYYWCPYTPEVRGKTGFFDAERHTFASEVTRLLLQETLQYFKFNIFKVYSVVLLHFQEAATTTTLEFYSTNDSWLFPWPYITSSSSCNWQPLNSQSQLHPWSPRLCSPQCRTQS